MRTEPVVVFLVGLLMATSGCGRGVDPDVAAANARDRAAEVERALPGDVRVERTEELGECSVGLITATQDQFIVDFVVSEPLERAEQLFDDLAEKLGPGQRLTDRHWDRDKDSKDDALVRMLLRPDADEPLLIKVIAACY